MNVHSIHDSNYKNTLQKLKSFQGKIVILTTIGGFKTAEGHVIPLNQAIREIQASGNFIVLALEDTYVQQGVLGGFVSNGKLQGQEAGEIALKILTNTDSKFPESIMGTHNFIFNYQALNKFNITLPQDIAQKSQLLNLPVPFTKKYQNVLILAVYILVIIIVIGSLLFARYMYSSRKIIIEKGEKLSNVTESMSKAQAIAHLGNWDWDIKNDSIWWSDEIYRIFGCEPQEFAATYEAFMSYVHPDDREKINEAVNHSLENKSDYHVMHRIVRKDGSERRVVEEASLKLDPQGVPVSMIGIVHDITEDYERKQSIMLQSEIFNAVQDSIMVHDLEGNFIYLNENAWRSRGYSKEEMLNMTVKELDAPEYDNATPAEMKKLIQKMKEQGYVKFEVEHVCKNGERFPVEIYSKLITLDAKQYILSSARDITEQKKANTVIEASEQKYRNLVENSMVGIYRTNLSGEILYVNPALAKIMGYDSAEELIGKNTQIIYHSSQDREKFIDLLQKTGRLTNYEVLAKDKNNKHFPIMLSASLEGDTLTGMLIDMRELKKSQEEIEKLSKVVEQVDDSVVITDNKGAITYANQAFYKHTGFTKEEVLGKTSRILKSGHHDLNFYHEMWHIILKGGVYRGTFINKKKNGELYYEKKTITPLKNDLNKIIGYVSSGQDITMETMMHKEIEHIASTDKLTGIYNRYKFEELFMLELERTRRFGSPLSLILLDIDHFKAVNDTYGHDVGDQLLKSLADVVQHEIRKIDIFARWGGEEFLILTPNTTLDNAAILAEKLRLAIETYTFPTVKKVTISAGISQLQEDDSFDEFFKRTDQALYVAKDKGRNQVSTSSYTIKNK